MSPHGTLPRRLTHQTQLGLTLVELMVSLAIGLLVLAALVTLFVNSSNARRELDRSAILHETGRYAMEFLREDLMHAGYYGPLVNVAGVVDEPCSTDVTEWRDSLALHVRGSNQGQANFAACLPDTQRRAGTDAIFLQRASTCAVGEPGCVDVDFEAGLAYLQVSGCGEEYTTTPFVAAVAGAEPGAQFNLRTRECVEFTTAPVRRYLRRIYYVAPDASLNYIDITPGGATAPVLVTEGVENLQLEYGIDTTGDGQADLYTSTPTAGEWPNALGARIWILSRAPDEGGPVVNRRVVMGDVTLDFEDRWKRHVFSSYVTFLNPQGLRE